MQGNPYPRPRAGILVPQDDLPRVTAGIQQGILGLGGTVFFDLKPLKLKKKKVPGGNYDVEVDDTGIIVTRAGGRNIDLWGGSVEVEWIPPGEAGCTYAFINTVDRSVEWTTYDAAGNPILANTARNPELPGVPFNVPYSVDGAKGPNDPTSKLTKPGKKAGFDTLIKHDDPALSPGMFLAAANQGASADPNATSVEVTVTWKIAMWFIKICNGVYSSTGFHEFTITTTKTFSVANGAAVPDPTGAPKTIIEDTDSGPGNQNQRARLNGILRDYGVQI